MIELLFCGDIFLANTTFTKGIGLGAKVSELSDEKKIDSLFTIANNSDIVFCNLECPLTKNIKFVKSNSFIGPSNAAKLLKNSKINIVSIANNHILDYGNEIYQETLQILRENNIKYIGEYENGLSNIVIFNQNGIKIAFAAFNEVDLHKINNPNLFAELNEKNVELTLKKMNGFGVNFKVVSFHWGDEYITVPSSHQIELGHFAIDRGANIVVGHHPHVVQPIECYKNGLIMYSLGNCIFDFLQSKQFREGTIVRVNIDNKMNIKHEVFPIKLVEKDFFNLIENGKISNDLNYQEIIKSYFTDKEGYNKKYTRLLARNRLIERIKMKIHLLKKLLTSKFQNKFIILYNLLNYLVTGR